MESLGLMWWRVVVVINDGCDVVCGRKEIGELRIQKMPARYEVKRRDNTVKLLGQQASGCTFICMNDGIDLHRHSSARVSKRGKVPSSKL